MYGEDASGRRVSLININCGPSPIIPKATITNTFKVGTTLPFAPSKPVPILPPILPPLDSLTRNHDYRCRKRRSVSPEASTRSTPPLTRHDSTSSRSDSTTSPMTPSYSQDPLDSQNKPATYFPSRQHAQLYQNMLAQSQQKPFAPQPYSLPPLDMGSDDLINGLGALNQQAIHNLAAPLTYPDPEPSMSVRNTSVADLQPANFATSARSATSINTPSNYHQQQENRPSSQSAGTQTSTASPTAAASTPAKKKFPCPHAAKFDCADTFTTSGHASRHGKKHTGEKSVICPTCSKAFTRKDNMKQHERTHKDGKSSATSSPISTSAQHAHKTSEGSASKAQVNGRVKATSARSEEEDGEGESPGLDALAMAANME